MYSPNQLYGETAKNINGTPFNNDIINKSIEVGVSKASATNVKNFDIPGITIAGSSTANEALNKTGMSISLPNSSLFKETSREYKKENDFDFTKYFEQNMAIGN